MSLDGKVALIIASGILFSKLRKLGASAAENSDAFWHQAQKNQSRRPWNSTVAAKAEVVKGGETQGYRIQLQRMGDTDKRGFLGRDTVMVDVYNIDLFQGAMPQRGNTTRNHPPRPQNTKKTRKTAVKFAKSDSKSPGHDTIDADINTFSYTCQ